MKILTSIAVCVLSICISIPVMADENSDALNTLDALNHAIVSIYKVEKRPSKVTVDEEYNAIINNIAWGNIKDDSEFQDLIREMMNAYTENRLEAKEREMLRRQYEVQVNRAFLEVKPLSHLQTEAAVNTAQQLSGSLFGGLLSAAASGVGEFTMALQTHERMKMQALGQEQEYMQQRMAGEWELDKAKIRRFNTLKTSLLTAVWTLLNRYNLPDEARLTEDNLDQFYAFISEKDVAKALRMGKRLETNFSKYPPYWFYLGCFYLQKGDSQEARACFDKFEEVNRPILRKDTFAAAAARYKIFTLNEKEVDEAKRLVGIIEKQAAADDWNTVLFAALQNYQLGDKKKAEDLLLQNIDNGFNVPLNTEILHQMQKGKFDLSAVQGVAIRQFKEPSQLEKLAKAGNAEAQYAYGKLVWGNKEAKTWMEQAAKQGHFFAKCWLITGEPQKYEKETKSVFAELSKKSDEGNAEAQFYLGFFYLKGIGTSKDEQKAFACYQKSAEQGYASAQNRLGLCYQQGIGTSKDEHKAFGWYQKAAEQGHAVAQLNLGFCYETGIGTSKDEQKAFVWYQKSAEQGNASAQNKLGFYYRQGIGTSKDEQKAFSWYQKSAEQGNASAQFNLGACYENGFGTAKDEQKAFVWYQKAAEQGNAAAQSNLGFCYQQGIGTPKDEQKAFALYKKAAEQGNAVAQSNLGFCYQYGVGRPKDKTLARMWYQRAADQGDDNAKKALEEM